MNITRENIDALNAVVTVAIEKKDYNKKVEKILLDYRKKANIPGFRKGQVPMGMVKKQYGKAVLVDEVNKILQENLNKYLAAEKLDLLGNPLPRKQDDLNWEGEDFSFQFELGLAPSFDVNLKNKKAITQYNIVADEKTINDQIENIRKQYGKISATTEITEETEITGVFKNEEKAIENTTTFSLDKIKGKTNTGNFLKAKIGDILILKTKNLFNQEHDLISALKVSNEDVQGLDIEVTFEITETNNRSLAEMDQEFFDKLFGKDLVKSESELKARLKEDAGKQFAQQADQRLLNDVTEHLVENTKFDLPQTFLEKWMQNSGENPLSEEQAKEEYAKSEKALRYQLIEGKLLKENGIQVQFEDLKTHTTETVRTQMAQFGQTNPSDEELEGIVARVLSNQDEARKLGEQLVSKKLLAFYKDNINLKVKELNYEEFIKEVYN
ncbi:MAG: trigger factor [Kordia sp.]|nr:MAG: trigger factor [Kordia sp.]